MLKRNSYWQHGFPFLAAGMATFGCVGCQTEVPKFQAHGQVVYADNGEPVPGVLTVIFESTVPPYARASGALDTEGRFFLSSRRQGDGSMQGEHRVRFTAESSMVEPNPDKTVAKYIDKKYCQFGTSEIALYITPNNDNNFLIEVERGVSESPPPPPTTAPDEEEVVK